MNYLQYLCFICLWCQISCAPTPESFFDAVVAKCPAAQTLKDHPVFTVCKDWKKISEVTQLSENERDIQCLLFFNSFIEYCPKVKTVDKVILDAVSVQYDFNHVCNYAKAVPNKTLRSIFSTEDNCRKICTDEMGSVNSICRSAYYFAQNLPKAPSGEVNVKLKPVALEGAAPQTIVEKSHSQTEKGDQEKKSVDTEDVNKPRAKAPARASIKQDNQSQKDPASDVQQPYVLKNAPVIPQSSGGGESPQVKKIQPVTAVQPSQTEDVSKLAADKSPAAANIDEGVGRLQEGVAPLRDDHINAKANDGVNAVKDNDIVLSPPDVAEQLPNKNKDEAPSDNQNKKNEKPEPEPEKKVEENPDVAHEEVKDGPHQIMDPDMEEDIQGLDPQDEDIGQAGPDSLPNEKDSKPLQIDQSEPVNYNTDMEGDSYFFTYFMVLCIIFIVGYVCYHNKQKILALILEGRKGKRQYRGRRPNSANYHKLDSNLEEAITSSCQKNTNNVIY